MAKKAIICLLVLSCTVFCFGSQKAEAQKQEKPNLSRTWKLDKSKGDYVKYSGLKPQDELVLVISHADPEIKVTLKLIHEGQEYVQELIYYSDGRGEVSRTFISDLEGKSKTKWESRKLVSRFTAEQKIAGTRLVLDVIQEWKLSADGRTLTQTQRSWQTNSSGPTNAGRGSVGDALSKILDQRWSPDEIKRVFNRVS